MAADADALVLDYSEAFLDADQRFFDMSFQDSDNIDNNFWSDERINREISRSDVARCWSGGEVATQGLKICANEFQSDDSEAFSYDASVRVFEFPQVFVSRRIGEKSVNTLAEWECVLDWRDDENRTIEVFYDQVLGGEEARGRMSIPFDEFSDRDLERVSRGHVFRLIVGYSKRQDGSRRRESIVYVRPQILNKTVKFGKLLDLLVDQ